MERTGDAVAEVEELDDIDELPVVMVGVAELVVMEALRSITVSHEQHINILATELEEPTNVVCPECGIGYSPGAAHSRAVLVPIANHHADDSTDEDDDGNDQGDDDGGSVLAPLAGLLAGVHDGRASGVADVIRLHDSARGRRRVVAFHGGEVRDGLQLGDDSQFR